MTNYQLLEFCKCNQSQICLFCVQLTIVIISIVLGIFLIWQAKRVIEMQIAFYKFINWKIEPISWPKELRNTRIMGGMVLIFGIAALIYIII